MSENITKVGQLDMLDRAFSESEIEAAEKTIRQGFFFLLTGNEDGLRELIESYFRELKLAELRDDVVERTLSEIGVCVRTCNALSQGY